MDSTTHALLTFSIILQIFLNILSNILQVETVIFLTETGLLVMMRMMMMLVISPTDPMILYRLNHQESFLVGELGLEVPAEEELGEMKKIQEKEIEKMPYPTPQDVKEAITTDLPPEEDPKEPAPRSMA